MGVGVVSGPRGWYGAGRERREGVGVGREGIVLAVDFFHY